MKDNLRGTGDDTERTTTSRLSFLWRGELVELDDFEPTTTILEFLREHHFATGTKEGCNEGDCGACTIVLGRPENGKLRYRAINACIQFLGTLHGAQLLTVEDLQGDNCELHPAQATIAEKHAAQCGFCTPGFVMSLFALTHRDNQNAVSRQIITDAVAGNLCRCTGYRPIIDAAFAACAKPVNDQFSKNENDVLVKLASIDTDQHLYVGNNQKFFASPASEDELANLYLKHPDALLVAGATDIGLWVTKQLREFEKIIYLGRVNSLNSCFKSETGLEIGAAVTFANAHAELAEIDPDLGELVRRIGSEQIRNSGTVGGNIANGSPIGDSPPALIALDAEIELREGKTTRQIPLETFFIEYGEQDRAEGEFVRAINIPKLGGDEHFRCFKIAKRFDQDISSVLGAMRLKIVDGTILEARIAFGGMAGTPKRASNTEAALININLSDQSNWRRAVDNLGLDFQPMSDQRASQFYRMQAAKGLLTKALIELAEPSAATRLIALRPEQRPEKRDATNG